MSTTIKVSEETRDRVKALGAQTRQPADEVISEALDELERKLFWRRYAAQRAAQAGAPAAEGEAMERRAWDVTLRDGLDVETWGDDDLLPGPAAR